MSTNKSNDCGCGCVGTQGPQGVMGPQGLQGLQGLQGPTGLNNIYHSILLSIFHLPPIRSVHL